MKKTCAPGPRRGSVCIPASKSHAHRLLILAALGRHEIELRCDGISRDIAATAACLRALGAEIREESKLFCVRPIGEVPSGLLELPCGESGATLRFLLPLVGALGAEAVFLREGRLPRRPLTPLDAQLRLHGMEIEERGDALLCRGALRSGEYTLPGNVSSQFVSGLLMALPRLNGDSSLAVSEPVESAPYIAMTEQALRRSGIHIAKQDTVYRIPGGQRPALPEKVSVEGDWSNAAFFLCMGALSPEGICVRGLSTASAQGDREILDLLRRFGAYVSETDAGIAVCRGSLRGQRIDASAIPDLIPAVSVLAAAADGETRIENAGRLRLKESDRLAATTQLLRALGGVVTELPDGLAITGQKGLLGGTADSAGDHRIAMAAAVAACLCREGVSVTGVECVEKSYPRFWQDYEELEVLHP